jgi:hypothetical protein
VTSGQGGLRYQNLGSVSADAFEHDVALLLEDDVTLDDLRRRIDARCRLGEVAVEVFVRLGRNGPVTRINVDQPRSGVAAGDRTDPESKPPTVDIRSALLQV